MIGGTVPLLGALVVALWMWLGGVIWGIAVREDSAIDENVDVIAFFVLAIAVSMFVAGLWIA